MVSVKQMVQGVGAWIDDEILPSLLTGNVWNDLAVRGVAALVTLRGQNMISALVTNPLVKMMGVVDDDGMIDIDILKTVLDKIMPDGLPVEFPGMAFKMTLRPADVDKVYEYIMRG